MSSLLPELTEDSFSFGLSLFGKRTAAKAPSTFKTRPEKKKYTMDKIKSATEI